MATRWWAAALVVLAVLNVDWNLSSSAQDEPVLPPAATQPVRFEEHIQPILEAHCLKCHGRGQYKGGLSLETRDALLEGGQSGPAVLEGQSAESLLIELVAGFDPVRPMPDRADPLSDEEIGRLRAWIDQGLAWPEEIHFGFRQAPIEPRRPEIPTSPEATPDLEHPIDRFLAKYFDERGIEPDWTPVPDRVFARRVTLDLIGLLPTPEELDAFEADAHPEKRERLIVQLLDNRRAYTEHWLTFWNDRLRNAYRGTGFIDDGRKTITGWLYKSLYENKSYDQFVRELVRPVPGSEGFTKGIIWRGVVNASQVPPVQAAQNVTQVFLGSNLKCASCHDSFVNHWSLNDAYALAAVFAPDPLEISRCDLPTGQTAEAGFIYPELGHIDADLPLEQRLEQLADLLVTPENGRFARTMVNRLWAALFGRGLVEPLDDMDQAPWDQDLLDWLAGDFVEHGHDLKHTLRLICTSRAYQLPAASEDDPSLSGDFEFRGPLIKRMSAEQFLDAIAMVTQDWPKITGEMLKVDGRGQGGQVLAVREAIAAAEAVEPRPTPNPPHVEARWIWSHADAENDPGGRILLRKSFDLEVVPDRAVAVATCDNELALYINGEKVADSEDWSRPVAVEVTAWLRPGENVIAAEATNWPDFENQRGIDRAHGPNPAAFIAWIGGFEGTERTWGIGSDPSWLWTKAAGDDWRLPAQEPEGWEPAAVVPTAPRTYPGIDLSAAALEAFLESEEPLRAALLFDDPLLVALGRTNREQVVTRRDSIATTLQALELTNGATLDAKLERGAMSWVDRFGDDPERLVRELFLLALNRPPTAEERAVGLALIGPTGTKADPEGVQDLLWAVLMLPEFQLIY